MIYWHNDCKSWRTETNMYGETKYWCVHPDRMTLEGRFANLIHKIFKKKRIGCAACPGFEKHCPLYEYNGEREKLAKAIQKYAEKNIDSLGELKVMKNEM